MRGLSVLAALLLLAASGLAQAQSASPPRAARPRPAPARAAQPPADNEDDSPSTVSELVVTAGRAPGAVIGDIKPEITLTPQEVQSYGVATVTGAAKGETGLPAGTSRATPGRPCRLSLRVASKVAFTVAWIPARIGRV